MSYNELGLLSECIIVLLEFELQDVMNLFVAMDGFERSFSTVVMYSARDTYKDILTVKLV